MLTEAYKNEPCNRFVLLVKILTQCSEENIIMAEEQEGPKTISDLEMIKELLFPRGSLGWYNSAYMLNCPPNQ